jgi:hypothetical protein
MPIPLWDSPGVLWDDPAVAWDAAPTGVGDLTPAHAAATLTTGRIAPLVGCGHAAATLTTGHQP